MTREEAILHIEKTKEFLTSPKICWSKYDDKITALDIAIEALQGGDADMTGTSPYMQPSPDSGVDLISRADAICEVLVNDGMDNIVDRINTLPSAEAKWIPCSERLPKKGEVVLITNGKGNVRCGQYRSEYDVRYEKHYWWWKGKTVETVLAWMPLPEPYREDGEV